MYYVGGEQFLKLCTAFFDDKLPAPTTYIACPCAPHVVITTDPGYVVRGATKVSVGRTNVKDPQFQLDIAATKDVLKDEGYKRALLKATKLEGGKSHAKVVLYTDESKTSVRTISYFYSHLAVLRGVEADVVCVRLYIVFLTCL